MCKFHIFNTFEVKLLWPASLRVDVLLCKVLSSVIVLRTVSAMSSSKRLDWSPKKRTTAITLRDKGYSYREIVKKIGHGVSPAGAMKLCKRFAETWSIKNKAKKGSKRATTSQTDRINVRMALKNHKTSLIDVWCWCCSLWQNREAKAQGKDSEKETIFKCSPDTCGN